ncbi:helix-turn-helix transcriptional regulator [Aestuariicella hydrocarbonica]|uniref:Helix-turn-helix transcriptional regulator n=1 Tax=Pseudomaricurvus hydrocarbonicus TaxID=1470433 RepID=A0A9E5MQK4_9GAMM|nr:helix-turn-helix transcriptional regulator [Aestuariicella hydrocarbonica]NHO68498.1 helix-turn-helix transcriptional regulator [Aestuariicella hydrocarbonica]
MDNPALLDLVGEIYEASLHPTHWNHVLTMLCQQLDIKSGALLVHDLETGSHSVVGNYGIATITRHAYSLGLGKLDIGWKAVTRHPQGSAFQFADHIETRREHPFYYRMMMKPLKVHYMGGITVSNDAQWQVGLGLHRTLQQGPFDQLLFDTLETLAPHFSRAMRIQREFHRLRVENFRLNHVLARMMMGVVIVNEWREVVYCNPVAEQILTNNPTVKLRGKVLSAYSNAETAVLNQAIDDLLHADAEKPDGRKRSATRKKQGLSKSLGLTHPEKASPLAITLTNTNTDAGGTLENLVLPARAVTLYLTDPNLAVHLNHDSLMEVYGLTLAEAKVAIMIANGMVPKDIAEHNQVSVLTVRTQLRHVFDKMGVNRQQDIVKILLSGALSPPPPTAAQEPAADLEFSDT